MRGGWVTGPPAARPEFQAAPPIKRASPDGIPVRLSDGALVAHVIPELADRLLKAGAAESFRSGSRRYLRLRQGISIPHSERGWDIIEFLRTWHGDKRAAGYVAHKDQQSERLHYRPPSSAPERLRSVSGLTRRPASNAWGRFSKSKVLRDRGAK
jgi:hypothetical protein